MAILQTSLFTLDLPQYLPTNNSHKYFYNDLHIKMIFENRLALNFPRRLRNVQTYEVRAITLLLLGGSDGIDARVLVSEAVDMGVF